MIIRGLSCLLTLAVAAATLLLALALGWTVTEVGSLNELNQSIAGTTEARRGAYRATATALASNEHSSLRAASLIILLQDSGDSPTAELATPEPATDSAPPAETPAPDDFNLPKLLLPREPAEGKWLSGTRVPRRAPETYRAHRLINIMLLGSDAQAADNFIRTDTMLIVSLNVETGAVAMLSLPRDLFVYIPHGNMGRLNTAFGIGENLEWDPGRGFGLLRQTIFYNFGINVHYYARVDFAGFEAIIDRLQGVDIAVDCAYRDYYPIGNAEERRTGSRGYRWRTLPVGYHNFDGFDALWYARTRKYTDDFDRGRRHQLLVRAIWRKARSLGLATTLPKLWPELTEIVDTDIPFDIMLRLLPFAINLDLNDVASFTFKKNFHTVQWTTPDGWLVLLPKREEVAQLMQALYTPPSKYQSVLTGPSIAVYNASGEEHWDIVASERLRWDGFNAIALGAMADGDEHPSNHLTDRAATVKGSLVPGILRALNMTQEQVEVNASADREYDYEVIIGRDYESCTYGVLPFDG
ncbi:MAG: LCP family protein [Chloroflexota bacterium]|nr:LCP family protein [Chloroflexota bacterium]MDE2946263.1 LCP family protein [Chloroflexota bacterium]